MTCTWKQHNESQKIGKIFVPQMIGDTCEKEVLAMGNFYVNFTARGPEQAAIVRSLRSANRKAFVGPTLNALTVYFDELADTQDGAEITHVGQVTSRDLNATVLAVLNHDDDILIYWLFEKGKIVDEYNSCPGYFDGGEDTPSGGDAEKLCVAFAVGENVKAVDGVLHNKEYTFALDRHVALAELLGLPSDYIGASYRDLKGEETPEGASSAGFVQVE